MKKSLLCIILALCMFVNAHGAFATGFTLPSHLNEIDAHAFSDCERIRGLLRIPGNTRSVGSGAFAGADIFALEAENGVATIAADAFGGSSLCYILVHGKETPLAASLADTAMYVFAHRDAAAWKNAETSSAEFIDLANLISHDGFLYEKDENELRLLCASDNSVLPEEITIPVTVEGLRVKQIAGFAFFGCDKIRVLNLPEGITVSEGALDALSDTVVHFYETIYSDAPASDFTYTVNSGKVTVTGYTGNADVVRIPSVIEGCPVSAIERYAFDESPVSEWILPDSIETIYFNAFENAQLHSIRLPRNDNLVLGSECFKGAKNLAGIYLPEGLKEIGTYCFQGSGLRSIHIPSKIKSLGYDTFSDCYALSEVTFAPEGLEFIYGAFKNTALSKVVLPETVTKIDVQSFVGCGPEGRFEIWMGSAVNSLPDLRIYNRNLFPDGAIIYAPEGSYAAKWADRYENYDGKLYNEVYYGGGGCAEIFLGEHDYALVSDTVDLDAGSGLHVHNILYQCTRCSEAKTVNQPQPENACWRCEAKESYGSGASIPVEKFEFLDRYKLKNNTYYRIRLLADHNGVHAGHEALFMDEQLRIVVDRDVIGTLFRTHMYTGSGTLPWEYTGTESDYPTLEKREETISSLLANAGRSVSLASDFIKSDVFMEKLGSASTIIFNGLWGNPEGAIKSLLETVKPDVDIVLTAMHLTILNKLGESAPYDAQHYANSLKTIVDSNGFIVCEQAEASLEAYANAVAMWQLCSDNSSGIIDEIAACETDIGVGVRNIMTMLKGAAGAQGNPYAQTGVLVTSTMYAAITQADDIGEASADLIVKYIGDLAKIIASATGSSSLGAMVALYKADAFTLSEFLYVDGAMEKYESVYNAFCLKNSSPLCEAHDALAGA